MANTSDSKNLFNTLNFLGFGFDLKRLQKKHTQSKFKAFLELFGVEAWSERNFESLDYVPLCKTCCGPTILLEYINWTIANVAGPFLLELSVLGIL